MLEILAIIFLSRKNGLLAEQKGLKFWTWVWYNVLAWIGFEIAGVILGIILFGMENIVSVYIIGLLFASYSYFFIRSILNKKPDPPDDDINSIGVRDLYP